MRYFVDDYIYVDEYTQQGFLTPETPYSLLSEPLLLQLTRHWRTGSLKIEANTLAAKSIGRILCNA